MRQFESGATRDSEDGKLDIEGFLSPSVLLRFAKYMHEHRMQADGQLRDADNWQKGIPEEAYMKSLTRHFFEIWRLWDNPSECQLKAWEDALCAAMFNIQGLLFESLCASKGTMRQQISRAASDGYAEPVAGATAVERTPGQEWVDFYQKAFGLTPGGSGLVLSLKEGK